MGDARRRVPASLNGSTPTTAAEGYAFRKAVATTLSDAEAKAYEQRRKQLAEKLAPKPEPIVTPATPEQVAAVAQVAQAARIGGNRRLATASLAAVLAGLAAEPRR